MTFNYIAEDRGALASLAKRAGKQGSRSTTRRMLAERAAEIDAEQEATGQPPAWKDVYETVRCPGPPCPRGPYCWQDPNGKKHHPLKTRELQALVLHVQRGNALKTHDDIPDDLRQRLYAAERQQYERHHTVERLTSLTRSSRRSSSRTCFQARTVTLQRNQLCLPYRVAWSSLAFVTLL
jgi:hypothetical protein